MNARRAFHGDGSRKSGEFRLPVIPPVPSPALFPVRLADPDW